MSSSSSAAEALAKDVMAKVVARLAQEVGFEGVQTSTLNILTDIMRNVVLTLGRRSHAYADEFGRLGVGPNMGDVLMTMRDLRMNIPELEEYLRLVAPVTLSQQEANIPFFPVRRKKEEGSGAINFLTPGPGDIVMTKPDHIPDYMPPMILVSNAPRTKVRDESDKGPMAETPRNAEVVESVDGGKKQGRVNPAVVTASDKGNFIETSGEDEVEILSPDSSKSFTLTLGKKKRNIRIEEEPALKKIRKMLEQSYGHRMREVTSVTMNPSGMLTSFREGKLPAPRRPSESIATNFFVTPPPSPPPQKEPLPLSMKGVVGVRKKIYKKREEKLQESDKEEELFAKPDQIVKKLPQVPKVPPSAPSSKIDNSLSMIKAGPNVANTHNLFLNWNKSIEETKKSQNLKTQQLLSKQNTPEVEELSFLPQQLQEVQLSFKAKTPVMPNGNRSGVGHSSPFKFAKKKAKAVVGGPREAKKFRNQDQRTVHNATISSPGRLSVSTFTTGGMPAYTNTSNNNLAIDSVFKKNKNTSCNGVGAGGGVPLSTTANFGQWFLNDDGINPVRIQGIPTQTEMEPNLASSILEAPLNVALPQGPPPPWQPNPPPPAPAHTQSKYNNLLNFNGHLAHGAFTKSSHPSLPPVKPMWPQQVLVRPTQTKEASDNFRNVSSSLTTTPVIEKYGQMLPGHFVSPGVALANNPMLIRKPWNWADTPPAAYLSPMYAGNESPGLPIIPVKSSDRYSTETMTIYSQDHNQSENLQQNARSGEESIKTTLDEEIRSDHSTEQNQKDTERTKKAKKEKKEKKNLTKKEMSEEPFSPPPPSPKKVVPKLVLRISRPTSVNLLPQALTMGGETSHSLSKKITSKPTPKPEQKAKQSKEAGTLVTETVGLYDEHGIKIWICPLCDRMDDGSPMIGCDGCEDWFHFHCVGVTEEPEEGPLWFCPRPLCQKKQVEIIKV